MPPSRIDQKFVALKSAGTPGLVAYLTAGDPAPERTPELALALERGGADFLELGVPFSDPIADGPVIQRASERALHAGTSLDRVLEIGREIRKSSQIPLILFSYMNPLLRYGFERLARDASATGIDGILMTDLSVEEAAEPVRQMRAAGLDTIFLAAPTSTPRRLKLVAEYSSGFVYVVSRTGVTGERDSVSASAAPLIQSLRAQTALPLAVGFGVSTPAQFEQVAQSAEAVVVGSAFVRLIEEHGSAPDGPARLEHFARLLKGR